MTPKQRPRIGSNTSVDTKIRLTYARAIIILSVLACLGGLWLQSYLITGSSAISAADLVSLELPFVLGVEGSGKSFNKTGGITIERVDIDSDVDDEIRFELLNAPDLNNIDLSGKEPKVLIYHTHTTEAYTQTQQYQYKEAGEWRTHDNTRNVVAVGELLTKLLKEKYGIAVIHDSTDHEPPKLSTSYSRSLETMLKYKKEYPSITMFIDLHRDAYNVQGENTDYVVIDGQRVARMMFVVGTGKGATGNGFGEMPDFSSNYALAKLITDRLNLVNEKFMRNIRVKTGRYNQHVSNQCLLVEVGHNANTLEEALNAMPYLAEAIAYAAGIDTSADSPAMSNPTSTPSPTPSPTPSVLPLAP